MMFAGCVWLNEPAEWSIEGEALTVATDARTDFWRETHYGFTRDSGHFFGREAPSEFTAQVRIDANFTDLYDQAGLMVRVGLETWVKAGVELSDGRALFSSVLTAGRSDWAIGAQAEPSMPFWLRATLAGGAIRLQVSRDGREWPLLRLAPFPSAPRYRVGPMCCTPERSGLKVRFSEFHVGPAVLKDLHDLT